MLVLFESSAGYALFKINKESKLARADDIFAEFETPEKAGKLCVQREREGGERGTGSRHNRRCTNSTPVCAASRAQPA